MRRELCFLTSSGWSVPSIQPTLLQPHQSLACQFAQTARKYLLCWLCVLRRSAKDLSCTMHTWRAPNLKTLPANSCIEVTDTFSADRTGNCMIRVIRKTQWGLLFFPVRCAAMWKSLHIYSQRSLCPAQIGSLHIPHLFNDTTVLCKCSL